MAFLYRSTTSYSASLGVGKWQARDPLANAEIKQGPNLYKYSHNEPINRLDKKGLSSVQDIFNNALNVAGYVVTGSELTSIPQCALGALCVRLEAAATACFNKYLGSSDINDTSKCEQIKANADKVCNAVNK